MNKSETLLSTALLLGLVTSIGCGALREFRGTELSDKVRGSAFGLPSGDDLDERELCLETAKTVAGQGHAAEAIKLYEKAERLAPQSPRLDRELAPLYAQVGNVAAAVSRYRGAIMRGNTTPDVFNNLAWTLLDAGRIEEASEVIGEGLVKSPNDPRLRATQAILSFRGGDRDQALRTFRELYGPAIAHHNLAILEVERGDFSAALKHLDLAAQSPECPSQVTTMRDALLAETARIAALPTGE